MAKYILVRNDCRQATYQRLATDTAAIEPPIWMMLREQMLKAEGHEVKVMDTQTEGCNFYDITCEIGNHGADHVELFPTGNHPSAYIQQRDDIEMFVSHLGELKNKTEVHYTMKFSPINIKSDWSSFDMSKYRAHNWHCDWGTLPGSPYGVIFTSIGCPFSCQFCCIKDYYGTTYEERPLQEVMNDISDLVKNHNIRNIKVMDEIFFLKKQRVEELCDRIIAENYDNLNMWAYTRIDTISQPLLEKLKKAGFRWLCVGIESGNEEIRKKASKGNFTNEKIVEVVGMMKDAGISVIGNFIFGFPDDNLETMRETLDFAMKLKCEFTNLYTMMAYPGSELHQTAKENGWELPGTWSGYSQYSYRCHPIRTHHLTSREVLAFRDEAFRKFYLDPDYLSMIGGKFGADAVHSIDSILKVKLKRKLLEEQQYVPIL